MLPWLLIVSLNTALSLAGTSSTGPVSPTEADILWTDARKALDDRKLETAVPLLTRLVDRYPGYPGHLESHFILGQTLLTLKQDKKAIPYLRFYVSGAKSPEDLGIGRISLGWALIRTQKYQEAYLTSLELEKLKAYVPHALLLRARAQVGLKRNDDAILSLAALPKDLTPFAGNNWLPGEVLDTQHFVKLAQCKNLASRKPTPENDAIESVEKQSACLMESFLIFEKLVTTSLTVPIERALVDAKTAWKVFHQSCMNPPPPKYKDQKPREAKDFVRYKKELRSLLSKKYTATKTQLKDFLDDWRKRTTAEDKTLIVKFINAYDQQIP